MYYESTDCPSLAAWQRRQGLRSSESSPGHNLTEEPNIYYMNIYEYLLYEYLLHTFITLLMNKQCTFIHIFIQVNVIIIALYILGEWE